VFPAQTGITRFHERLDLLYSKSEDPDFDRATFDFLVTDEPELNLQTKFSEFELSTVVTEACKLFYRIPFMCTSE
jgi:hypothetical protein